MSAPVVITREHVERAYAQLRRRDWPTLEEMERAHKLYMIVRGQAANVANGRTTPPEPVAAAPPATHVPKPAPWPPPPQRRREDAPAPFSTRAAASGEYVHPDD